MSEVSVVAWQGAGEPNGGGCAVAYQPVQVHEMPFAAEADQHPPVEAGHLPGLRKEQFSPAEPGHPALNPGEHHATFKAQPDGEFQRIKPGV